MDLFITGTNTDVGKTFVTGCLATVFTQRGLKVAVYKPFQTGAPMVNGMLLSEDLCFVKQMCTDIHVESEYLMANPCTPQAAAEAEGIDISIENVVNKYEKLKQEFDVVLVEGAGGIAVPIKENFLTIDLIKALDMPILVVADSKLGTISNILTTLSFAQHQQIKASGLILNKYPFNSWELAATSLEGMLNQYLNVVPILGKLPEYSPDLFLDRQFLIKDFKKLINIDRLVNTN